MRVEASKAVRVAPGDLVFVRGQLDATSRVGRLYIFAKPHKAPAFAPYVPHVGALPTSGRPILMSLLSMRLSERAREKEISFTADITGQVKVMQEIDRPSDPRVKVTIKRQICPDLPWKQRLSRKLHGILAWLH